MSGHSYDRDDAGFPVIAKDRMYICFMDYDSYAQSISFWNCKVMNNSEYWDNTSGIFSYRCFHGFDYNVNLDSYFVMTPAT